MWQCCWLAWYADTYHELRHLVFDLICSNPATIPDPELALALQAVARSRQRSSILVGTCLCRGGLEVVCCLLFVVCCLLFVACCLLLVVCCVLFVAGCLLLVVCCVLFVVCFFLLLPVFYRSHEFSIGFHHVHHHHQPCKLSSGHDPSVEPGRFKMN